MDRRSKRELFKSTIALLVSGIITSNPIITINNAWAKEAALHHQEAKPEEEEKCSECHQGLLKFPHVHSAMEAVGCLGCHESSPGYPLTERDAALCYGCHTEIEELANKEYVHGPVAADDCLACHNPHASPNEKQLIDPQPQLCLSCHSEKEKDMNKNYVHAPFVAGECTLCHSPHGSSYQYQLIADKKMDLCLNCHKDKKKAISNSKEMHGAIKKFGCPKCHSPHASDFPLQLILTLDNNALCLSCHQDKINVHLQHPIAGHPVRDRPDPLKPGRELGCFSCHDPHASQGPTLLKGASLDETCLLCHKF